MIGIEPPISRHESFRMRLASDTSDLGPSSFFINKVPFSGRTGNVYARRLVHVYQHIVSELSEDVSAPYHVMELGAGLGFLSRRFYEVLQEEDPGLAENTIVHITDVNQQSIDLLSNSEWAKQNADHVKVEYQDALNLNVKMTPVFCFSTYLLDALPQRHFEYSGSKLHEILVETFIEDTLLVDTRQNPPKMTSTFGIKTWLNDQDKRRHMMRQIEPILSERFSVSPLLNDEFDRELDEFLSDYSPKETVTFNAGKAVREHLRSVLNNLHPEGAYLISDFGFANLLVNVPKEQLIATYGVAAYYGVCFPWLQWQCKRWGISTDIVAHESDQTQDCLLTKKQISDELKKCVQTEFKTMGDENVSKAIDTASLLTDKNTYQRDLSAITACLTEDEKNDYFYLVTMATQLLDDGYANDAKELAEKLIYNYGDLAAEGHRLLGCIYQNDDDHDNARLHFEKALHTFPEDSVSHAALGMTEMCMGDYAAAARHFENAIRYTHDDQLWQQLLALVLAYRHSNQSEKMKNLLAWVLDVIVTYPGVVPANYEERFKAQWAMLEKAV